MIDGVTTEKTDTTVSTIRISYEKTKAWEQWVLISSDRHIDNPQSLVDLQKRHLKQAKERNALIIDCGDLFDAMQGKYDPRSSKKDLDDDFKRVDYLDALVDNAYEMFRPYADNIALLGYGNHETSIRNRHETDLTKRLVKRLQKDNEGVLLGGYRGWVRMLFSTPHGNRQSVNLYYTHGAGGNSPVSKGVLNAPRRAVYLPDADIVCAGHIHERWLFPIMRARLTHNGYEYTDEQLHIQLPTYKEEFLQAETGFHPEKEGPPKPIGAWWLHFWWDRHSNRITYDAIKTH